MTSARCQRLRLPSELRDMRPIAELLCEQLPAEATTMKTNTPRVREESWRKTPFDRKAVQCGYATQRYCFGRPDVREIFVGPNAERCVVFTIKVNCTTSSSYAAAQQDSNSLPGSAIALAGAGGRALSWWILRERIFGWRCCTQLRRAASILASMR